MIGYGVIGCVLKRIAFLYFPGGDQKSKRQNAQPKQEKSNDEKNVQ
jgi:hypothetical protein